MNPNHNKYIHRARWIIKLGKHVHNSSKQSRHQRMRRIILASFSSSSKSGKLEKLNKNLAYISAIRVHVLEMYGRQTHIQFAHTSTHTTPIIRLLFREPDISALLLSSEAHYARRWKECVGFIIGLVNIATGRIECVSSLLKKAEIFKVYGSYSRYELSATLIHCQGLDHKLHLHPGNKSGWISILHVSI